MLYAWESGQTLVQLAVKLRRAFGFVTREAGIDFEKITWARLQASIDRCRVGCAVHEQSRGRKQCEGERNLYDDEWVTRQEFPATAHHIFTGVLLQIGHDRAPRNFQGRPERKRQCAEQAKPKRGQQSCG